jgi:transposase
MIQMEVEMARFDLTDFEWSVIAPLLPNKPRGGARPLRFGKQTEDIRLLKPPAAQVVD